MKDQTLKELEAVENKHRMDREAKVKADNLIKMFQNKMVFDNTMYKAQAREAAIVYVRNMIDEYREFVGRPHDRLNFWKKVRDYLLE